MMLISRKGDFIPQQDQDQVVLLVVTLSSRQNRSLVTIKHKWKGSSRLCFILWDVLERVLTDCQVSLSCPQYVHSRCVFRQIVTVNPVKL